MIAGSFKNSSFARREYDVIYNLQAPFVEFGGFFVFRIGFEQKDAKESKGNVGETRIFKS